MKKALALILASLLMLSLLAACGDKTETPTDTAPASAADGSSAPDTTEAAKADEIPSFADGVLRTEDYTMTITDYKVVPKGEEGNQYNDGSVIAFFFDITNNSDEDLAPETPWMIELSAIQDNDPNTVNRLESAMWTDNSLNDQMIKPGGTSSYVQAYMLTDETTPITVKASELFGDDIGTQTFDIAK